MPHLNLLNLHRQSRRLRGFLHAQRLVWSSGVVFPSPSVHLLFRILRRLEPSRSAVQYLVLIAGRIGLARDWRRR